MIKSWLLLYIPEMKVVQNKSLQLIEGLCPGLDSNQHTSRRRHLKTVRLPISPPGLSKIRQVFINGR